MYRQVPFLDVAAINALSRVELDEAISRVISSGWLILGEELREFEREFARFCGSSGCVGVGNGLEALTLGLRALGVRAGDEVIVPANTYIATWLAVSNLGAVPVPVEPDPSTYNIDVERIEEALTARTKAILPVHLYGQPADMDAIHKVAARYEVSVLEDGAQAHGARYRGRRVGEGKSNVAWSFYPGKNLGALGDAGAVTSQSKLFCEEVSKLRNYGSATKYHNEILGYNSRLDELQAAVLRVKLRRLDEDNSRRASVAQQYLSRLSGVGITLPRVPRWAEPAWHLFVVQHEAREEFGARLAAQGIGTVVHYPIPPHLQPAYRHLGYKPGDFPLTEAIHESVISLPIGPTMSQEDVDCVVEAVLRAA